MIHIPHLERSDEMVVARIAAALLAVLMPLVPDPAAATVLFSDNFDGTRLDTTKWALPRGKGSFLGRTQLRPPGQEPRVANGVVRLRLDTYNPSAITPGDSFFGTEIMTQRLFARGAGLAFEARSRLVRPLPCGLVASVFTYRTDGRVRDEITFELLTNDLVAGRRRVLTNVFDDDDFSQRGKPVFVHPAGYDMTRFNIYKIVWKPDRVQWFVNGVLQRTERREVPEQRMNLRLNFWAPDAHFAPAYCRELQPARRRAANETYHYEVDYVRVTTVP
jgi:hypothetical protein